MRNTRQTGAPVALFIFNRPDTTERVFSAIAKARPSKLLVVADGPRAGRPGETEQCAQARALTEQVSWDCEVSRNYASENLGCGNRVASGLNWVFGLVSEAIILEDDCIPHDSFFRFCDELLDRYRFDTKVGHIAGTSPAAGRYQGTGSYYFSRYNHMWGWASWARAWTYYDKSMASWPQRRASGWLNGLLDRPKEVRYWTRVFDAVYAGEIDTWDYQWIFASWVQGMYTAVPGKNLVSNVGYRSDATHTIHKSLWSEMAVDELAFPLAHPVSVERDTIADRVANDLMFAKSPWNRLRNRLRRYVG